MIVHFHAIISVFQFQIPATPYSLASILVSQHNKRSVRSVLQRVASNDRFGIRDARGAASAVSSRHSHLVFYFHRLDVAI